MSTYNPYNNKDWTNGDIVYDYDLDRIENGIKDLESYVNESVTEINNSISVFSGYDSRITSAEEEIVNLNSILSGDGESNIWDSINENTSSIDSLYDIVTNNGEDDNFWDDLTSAKNSISSLNTRVNSTRTIIDAMRGQYYSFSSALTTDAKKWGNIQSEIFSHINVGQGMFIALAGDPVSFLTNGKVTENFIGQVMNAPNGYIFWGTNFGGSKMYSWRISYDGTNYTINNVYEYIGTAKT